MKAYEFSARITPDGKLPLPDHLRSLSGSGEVKVILLIEEPINSGEPDEIDENDESFSETSFRKSWQQAVTGKTLPLSQLWEEIGVE